MSGQAADCVFVILPEEYNPDKGYPLSAIWKEEEGVHKTDFYCGHDLELAMEWVNQLNAERGHNPDFTRTVLELVTGIKDMTFYNT